MSREPYRRRVLYRSFIRTFLKYVLFDRHRCNRFKSGIRIDRVLIETKYKRLSHKCSVTGPKFETKIARQKIVFKIKFAIIVLVFTITVSIIFNTVWQLNFFLLIPTGEFFSNGKRVVDKLICLTNVSKN